MPRYAPFEDAWNDEGDEWERAPSPSFRELHPNFNTGAVHPELVYPIEHGPECKGHPQREYVEEYLWTYVRTPTIHFYGDSVIVPVSEEYL
jgi:hypothetical protein